MKENMLEDLNWGLLFGFIIGCTIMIVTAGLLPYYNEYSVPVLPLIAGCFYYYFGGPIVAGAIAATGVRSWWEKPLAGALCGVPAAVTYWYSMNVAIIGDGIIAPVMVPWIMGFGAIGGLISLGIQVFCQTMQD